MGSEMCIRDSLEWLKGKITRYGIPEYPVLGARSADHFFLLVLHADRDPKFQLNCLNVFKSETLHWPKSYADTLEYRLTIVSPDVFKKQEDDTPETETPETETPKTETPKTETSETETPKTETPKTETSE